MPKKVVTSGSPKTKSSVKKTTRRVIPDGETVSLQITLISVVKDTASVVDVSTVKVRKQLPTQDFSGWFLATVIQTLHEHLSTLVPNQEEIFRGLQNGLVPFISLALGNGFRPDDFKTKEGKLRFAAPISDTLTLRVDF